MIEVIAGDIARAALLYEKYKRPLFAYYFKLTNGDRQASEDLVHTVFYRMIRYRDSFSGGGSFASWLFRIAHNTGIDNYRSRKLQDEYKSYALYRQTDFYELNDLETKEKYAILNLALSRLQPAERELLILSKINCLRYKEISRIVNLSENNVKIRIFRALKKLRELYVKIEGNSHEKTGLHGKAV
jgi:RNA polymerase sigma-70 factor, ECF subfamily